MVWGAFEIIWALVRGVGGKVSGWHNRPNVRIESIEIERKLFYFGPTSSPADFIYVNVRNHAERPAAIALDLVGHLWLKDADSTPRFYLPAHWGKSPAPAAMDQIALGPGQSASMDVVWKMPANTSAYGLSSAVMAQYSDWEAANLALPLGRYELRVKIIDLAGREAETRFWIKNGGTDGFEVGRSD